MGQPPETVVADVCLTAELARGADAELLLNRCQSRVDEAPVVEVAAGNDSRTGRSESSAG